MKVLYKHIRLDSNTVFYIGIGSMARAYNKTARTKYWKRIVEKCGYRVEIVFDNLSVRDAKSWEMYLIGLYGREDLSKGCLINMTDGGEAANGAVRSAEFRENLSRIRTGVARSEELKKILSDAKKGKRNPTKGKKRPAVSRGNHPLAISVTDGVNNWDCIKDAADFYNLNGKNLARWLRVNSPKLRSCNLKYIESDH